MQAGALTDVDQVVTFSADKLGTGYGQTVSLEARRQSGVGTYRLRLRMTSDRSIRLSASRTGQGREYLLGGTEPRLSGLVGRPGGSYRLRARVSGTAPTLLQARAWAAGSAEPSGWPLVVTDATPALQKPGGVGVFAYLGADATNAPLRVRVDGWTVSAAAPRDAVQGPLVGPRTSTTPSDPGPVNAAPAKADPVPAVADPAVPLMSGPALPLSPGPSTPFPAAPPALPAPSSPVESPATAPLPAPPATQSAGSLPVGAADYPVPSGAVFASVDGSDGATGTLQAPFRTVSRALAAVPVGGTVVLRAGSYHETVETPYGKRVTLQPYPHEAAWLDGSVPVSGFVADSGGWRLDGWSPTLDSTDPTSGAGDPNWRLVDPVYPMAAHPDMVWLDDVAQVQVGTRAALTPGTFYVDPAGAALHLGSDPRGHRVDAAVLSGGLYVNAGAGSTVRGIGVRRFATSLKQYGTVKAFADGVTLENVVVQDVAARGIGVDAAGVTLRRVTVSGAGQLGIGAFHSDGLQILDSLVSGNNTEHFHLAPESGGIKIVSSRDDVVRGTTIQANIGTGLWFDNSSTRATVVANRIGDNSGHGILYEISGAATIADNTVSTNGLDGLQLVGSNDVQVYNNVVIGNGGRAVQVWEDDRDATQQTPSYVDSRFPGQPGVTWNSRNVVLRNNMLVATGGTGASVLGVDDATRSTAGSAMVSSDYNGYLRTRLDGPGWVANWCTYGSTPAMRVFTDLASFAAATGQDSHGFLAQDPSPRSRFRDATGGDYRLLDQTRLGAPLPARVAEVLGLAVGSVLPIGRVSR